MPAHMELQMRRKNKMDSIHKRFGSDTFGTIHHTANDFSADEINLQGKDHSASSEQMSLKAKASGNIDPKNQTFAN